jgi:hypothetical protein
MKKLFVIAVLSLCMVSGVVATEKPVRVVSFEGVDYYPKKLVDEKVRKAYEALVGMKNEVNEKIEKMDEQNEERDKKIDNLTVLIKEFLAKK